MATWQMRKQRLRDRCEVTEVRAGLEAPPGSLNTKCHAQDRMLSDTYNSCPHRPLLGFLCAPCSCSHTLFSTWVNHTPTPSPRQSDADVEKLSSSLRLPGSTGGWHGPPPCCQNTHMPLVKSIFHPW